MITKYTPNKNLARQWARKWTADQIKQKLAGLERNAKNAPTTEQQNGFLNLVETAHLALKLKA